MILLLIFLFLVYKYVNFLESYHFLLIFLQIKLFALKIFIEKK